MHQRTAGITRPAWIAVTEIVLVAALAATLAYWTWVALAPPTVAAPVGQPQTDEAARIRLTRGLFGADPSGRPQGPLPQDDAALPVLRGVIAPKSRERGRALFAAKGGKTATVAVGEAVAAGVVLREVHPDHVVVVRDGVASRLWLERRAAVPDGAR